jgi:uncharacterized membrane protein
MTINWRAVGIGFVVTLVIGLIGGFAVPYTDVTIPALSWGVVGLVGGAVAGYLVGGGIWNGAVNGILATTIGALVVLVVLGVVGTLLLGLVGLSLYAIPGAVGGAVGALLKGATAPEAGQPIGR